MTNISYIESSIILCLLFFVLLHYNIKYEYNKKDFTKGIYILSIVMSLFEILRNSLIYEKFFAFFDFIFFAGYGVIGCLWILRNDFWGKKIKNLFLIPYFLSIIVGYLYPMIISPALWFIIVVFVTEVVSRQYKTVRLDKLTKLLNRYGMDDEFHEQLEQYKHDENDIFYVVACDMDNFKYINDKWGHAEGDRALRLVSDVLMRVSEKHFADAFRIGGDEFVIIADTSSEEKVIRICDELKEELSNIDFRDDYDIKMSVGMAKYDGKSDMEELLKKADKKLYEAKKNKK